MNFYPPRIAVAVTQDDITLGEPLDPTSCPIALALKRQFPEEIVIVDGECAEIANCLYSLPVPAREFAEKFDKGNDVNPLTFFMAVCYLGDLQTPRFADV